MATIPTASNNYSCCCSAGHRVQCTSKHARTSSSSITCRSGTQRLPVPSSSSSFVSPGFSSSKSASSSSSSCFSCLYLICALMFMLLFVICASPASAEDAREGFGDDDAAGSLFSSKYSFNGFAGGLITGDSNGSSNDSPSASESVISKRSSPLSEADTDLGAKREDLPSPSALRVEEKSLVMPEISLPTVTVRGFLNFRTTVDGTVIVFTPSSAAATAAASTSSAMQTEGSAHMQSTSAMRMNPFSYKTSTRSPSPSLATASQWSSTSDISSSTQTIDPSPVTSTGNVYPTGVVTVIADTSTGENGMKTVLETKVIGTYIEGKYAQILKSSSYVSTPVIPSGTFAVYHSSETTALPTTKRHELKRPTPARNSIHMPKFKDTRDKSEPVIRFTRGDRDQTSSPTEALAEASTSESPISRVRKPIGRLPGSGTGRYTWNRPVSERVRLNRFKVKVQNGQDATPGSSSRFTARDENDREAAKLLNQRLNRRLGISRSAPIDNRSPAPASEDGEKDHHHREDTSSAFLPPTGRGGPKSRPVGYHPPLLEGMLAAEAAAASARASLMPPEASSLTAATAKRQILTDVTTFTSEVTRGFAGGEPLIETMTHTSTIERTIEPSAAFAQPATDSVALASGMMLMAEDTAGEVEPTPPAVIVTKTYTLTESSSRTSLLPSIDGSITMTHTITESLIIRKLITAYKTIPGGEQNTALFESLLSEMNNSDYAESLIGSENILNPSLFQGTLDFSVSPTQSLQHNMKSTDHPILHPSLNLASSSSSNQNNANFGPQIDLNNPLVLGAALQNPGLAAMYFGLQQLSQQATQYTTIYKPTESLTTEVIYATKTLSFYDGRQTRTRTITEPGSTTTKLVSTTIQDVQPVINPQVLVQQAQLQRAFASQLLNGQNGQNFNLNSMNLFGSPSQQQQFQQRLHHQQQQSNPHSGQRNFQVPQIQGSTFTESITTVTSATVTSTKIYTLIYNALSTKFRTVTSTSVFPTTVTEIITKTLTPSASFNFFG